LFCEINLLLVNWYLHYLIMSTIATVDNGSGMVYNGSGMVNGHGSSDGLHAVHLLDGWDVGNTIVGLGGDVSAASLISVRGNGGGFLNDGRGSVDGWGRDDDTMASITSTAKTNTTSKSNTTKTSTT